MAFILRWRFENRVEAYDLPGDHLRIGRGAGSDLRLDDDAVSLDHAEIRIEGASATLTDLGSLTGTYVDGRRERARVLTAGDRVTIGPYLVEVRPGEEGQPLCLDIRKHGREKPDAEAMDHPRVAYDSVYSLRRGHLAPGKLSLSVGLGTVALMAMFLIGGREDLFRPGMVSRAHAIFGDQCSRCHEPWRGASEPKCGACHTGPVHHRQELFTPSCLTCHEEHRGLLFLGGVGSDRCTQCHADLRTRGEKLTPFATRITDFGTDHPEFAITARAAPGEKPHRLNEKGVRRSDRAAIKLNHEVHLKPRLKAPRGAVQLGCVSCHRPMPDNRRMAPVTYEAHCKECHELGFDEALPDRQAPHASPEAIRAYLGRTYAELQHKPSSSAEERGWIPGRTARGLSGAPPAQKVREAENHLFGVTCRECHVISMEGGPLPKIEKPAIPARWLDHALFSHKAHRMLACTACHADASKSRETADVLLPGIGVCRSCHRGGDGPASEAVGAAPARCSLCHLYHDKKEDRDWDGPLRIRDFSTRRRETREGSLQDVQEANDARA